MVKFFPVIGGVLWATVLSVWYLPSSWQNRSVWKFTKWQFDTIVTLFPHTFYILVLQLEPLAVVPCRCCCFTCPTWQNDGVKTGCTGTYSGFRFHLSFSCGPWIPSLVLIWSPLSILPLFEHWRNSCSLLFPHLPPFASHSIELGGEGVLQSGCHLELTSICMAMVFVGSSALHFIITTAFLHAVMIFTSVYLHSLVSNTWLSLWYHCICCPLSTWMSTNMLTDVIVF